MIVGRGGRESATNYAEELGQVTLVIPVWHTHLIQAPDSLRLIIWIDPD